MLFIGICGASGSGKSTLAHALQEKLGVSRCTVLQQDAYDRFLAAAITLIGFAGVDFSGGVFLRKSIVAFSNDDFVRIVFHQYLIFCYQ